MREYQSLLWGMVLIGVGFALMASLPMLCITVGIGFITRAIWLREDRVRAGRTLEEDAEMYGD